MYKVQFLPNDYIRSQKYHHEFLDVGEAEGRLRIATIECERAQVIGNNLHCELRDEFLYIVPLIDLIRICHIEGTPEYHESEVGGLLYHQYDREKMAPTGLATYNPDYLCIWLMSGYDVVIDSCDSFGNVTPHYIACQEIDD